MFTVKSNAYFLAETKTEAMGESYEMVLPKAVNLFYRGHRDVWVTDDSDKVLWHNGKATAPKLAGAELYKALTEAVRHERLKATAAHYFSGEAEQAQARTNSLINQILMED